MPWTKSEYPNSMKNLPLIVRNKAIEIANALMEEGKLEENILIATAISRAKDWAVNHGINIEPSENKSKSTDVKKHGEDRYVIPYGEKEWAVKAEGKKKVEYVFRSKKKAIDLATSEARKANAAVTIQKRTGKVEKRISFNPRRKTNKGLFSSN